LRLREEEIRIKEALAYAVFQEQFGSKHVPLGIEEKQGKERESFQKDNVQVVDVVLWKEQTTQQVREFTGSTVDPFAVCSYQLSLLYSSIPYDSAAQQDKPILLFHFIMNVCIYCVHTHLTVYCFT
jgi:hypothetical protein